MLLVQDVFTSFLEPRVLLGVFDLIRCLGFEPHVLPFRPNGKPLHLKGFDDSYRAVAAQNRALLTAAEALGMPLVGVDPAVTLTYRAGYGEDAPGSGVRVLLLQEWLVQEEQRIRRCLGEEPDQRLRPQRHYQLLAHCSERNAVPPGDWERVFSFFHLDLNAVDAFCCRRTDERCAPPLASLAGKEGREVVPLATGYTCRAELARAGGVAPRHPALVLLEALTTGRPLP